MAKSGQRGWSLAAVVVAGLLSARRAAAEEVHLVFVAPDVCPKQDDFVRQVDGRTDKATWVDARPDIRIIDVNITVAPAGALGKLVIEDPQAASPASREVQGQTCDEVVAALALITALAIDPAATLVVRPQPPPPTPPPQPPPPQPPPPQPPPPKPPLPKPPPEPPPSQPPVPARWRWLFGAGLRATSGLGDKLALVIPGYIDLTHDSQSWLAPSFRFGVSVLPDRVLTHPAGRGHLSRISARLDGCPVRGELVWLSIRPCASIEAGGLIARGEELPRPQTSTVPWVAAGLGAQVQLFPVDWLLLEITGEAALALVRPRFVLAPDLEIGRADLVFGVFGGGVGVRLP